MHAFARGRRAVSSPEPNQSRFNYEMSCQKGRRADDGDTEARARALRFDLKSGWTISGRRRKYEYRYHYQYTFCSNMTPRHLQPRETLPSPFNPGRRSPSSIARTDHSKSLSNPEISEVPFLSLRQAFGSRVTKVAQTCLPICFGMHQ